MESRALEPFAREGPRNFYAVQHNLQVLMQDLVGIVRHEGEFWRLWTDSKIARSSERVSVRDIANTTPAGTPPSICTTC